MTMQGPTSRRGSTSTVDSLELHGSLTLANSLRSSPSTLVDETHSHSNASSVDHSILAAVWEAAAEDVLRSTDLQAIQLLCRYCIYEDYSVLRSILRTRWVSVLNSFLLQLSAGTYSRDDVDNLSLDLKIQVILQRLVPPLPVRNLRSHWESLAALLESDASYVALQLDEGSLSWFREITFSDYIREALYPEGYVDSVEKFIDWHNNLFNDSFHYLEHFPHAVEKFAQIAEVSESMALPLL